MQVIASLKIFGVSAAAARIPAALWGIVLIPIVVVVVNHITRHRYLAGVVGTILVLDNFMIGLSRYVRMYSMLIVCLFIVGVAVYQWCETKTNRVRWFWAVTGLIALVLGISIFKELALALLGAIAVYVMLRWLMYLVKRQAADRYWFILGCVGVIFILLAVTLQSLGYKVFPLDAIIIRSEPHWTYLQLLFENWHFAGLAMIFTFVGIGSQCLGRGKNWRSFTLYCAILSGVVLSYFVFFSHRWDAQRYISFVIPFLTIVTAVGFYTAATFIYTVVAKPRWLASTLVVGFVIIAGPWLSWPGLPADGVVLRPALADQTAAELGYADMPTAYQYVLQRYQPGEIVLMQTPRFYYWTNHSIPVKKLGGYQSLSLAEFKNLAAEGNTGGWVIYNFTHQRHLRDNIKNFAAERFDRITELNDTLVVVYHFTPEDLAERRSTKK
ncbi:MAG: hypothetical protein ACD_43C00261G0001 [uncultured bacterium]|nr:MAG: hypothetical protein ACD_43C00261G0001 [uncultured bacterium]